MTSGHVKSHLLSAFSEVERLNTVSVFVLLTSIRLYNKNNKYCASVKQSQVGLPSRIDAILADLVIGQLGETDHWLATGLRENA
ncbi:hypothetical protein RRG08_066370 [Elysia crispata]|uniref:Uncharacterized protein n=1 Tax=Elysia crispata TaxID=231223 RepID=A0AAE1CUY9_9GAST|nr:hypothetical protein RRG08_066370 [Elysia crispata]